jgi:hypothetical protein
MNVVQSVNDNERSEYVCFRKVNNVQKVYDKRVVLTFFSRKGDE